MWILNVILCWLWILWPNIIYWRICFSRQSSRQISEAQMASSLRLSLSSVSNLSSVLRAFKMLLRVCLTMHKHSSYAGHIQNEGTLLPWSLFSEVSLMLFGSEGTLFLVPLATKAGQLQLGNWSVFGARLGEKGDRQKKQGISLDSWAHLLDSSGQKKWSSCQSFSCQYQALRERKQTKNQRVGNLPQNWLSKFWLLTTICLLLFTYIACFCILSRVVSSNQQKR